jgi:type IV secretion system protein VirD4
MQTIEQIFTILISGLEHLFEFLSGLISGIPSKSKEYKAEFAPESSLLSSWNKGFCLTGTKNLSIKHSFQNALVIGYTGSGKSASVIFPSLFSMKSSSYIIHDPSGEILEKSSGYLVEQGFDIKVLNFTKPENSSGYNPIMRANSSSEIQKISSMLIQGSLGGGKADPFWNNSAISLLSMLISILKTQEPEYQNLYNVRQLLNRLASNPKSVDALFSENADPVLFSEYTALIASDEKVLNGVISTCKASLSLFNDDAIAKVTSFDNIDFADFRKRPTALYIQNSVADQKYYSVLTSLFFEQYFSYVLSRFPKEGEQHLFSLIDEASSLKLPTLSMAVANGRKHSSGIMLLMQDYNQLVHQYGKHEADGIKANCFAKLYFTGASLETAKELEQMLGKYQYEDEQKRIVVRPLLTSDEIRTLKANKAILIAGHHPAILVRLKPYYKQMRYRNYSLIPPPEIKSLAPVGTISILPINSSSNEQDEQIKEHEQKEQ